MNLRRRLSFRVTPRRALAAIGSALALALLVAWSGVIDIGASGGHWRITSWGLHWVMQNATRTYAMLEPEPPADLDSPARIRRAAGHFETSCAFCHGSPEHPSPTLAPHMTPMPPGLTQVTAKWTPRELSRIVRHGVKYTGMPAWIAPQRSDEVWSMVAFLRALPEMSGEEYRRLAFGEAVPAPAADPALEGCVRCHGRDGTSSGGAFPVLGGQSEAYLLATLEAFADGTRPSGIMQFAVDGLPPEDLTRLAAYYAGRGGVREQAAPDGSEGARIAFQGQPENDVPACQSCHGASPRRNPRYPYLGGQDAAYLATQLRRMKASEARGPTARVMHRIAERLPDQAIDAVAEFYAGQGRDPDPANAAR
ncbi:c-type cytochrome [Ancylobacter dichloromethanicus]|uniref:Cytochrome c n=1 Tax=Ancylobacter dichloromethanicus TaxID=518825 RepID=A0A9W6JDR5_9HYPH|nr:c-type cytochrome [Ancylobacter dichloromethanicus]MBS7552220.1 c-type cytochrome [Ancylobacter dichloromethanicus]GLK73955.1 cytochrome c [Ancylobacter dichloromethanicus]